MSGRWPAAEAAQADYEQLRAVVLAGTAPVGPAASVFARSGLAGIIARPSATPGWLATLVGARRPAWTPHADPRLEALAAGYQFLLTVTVTVSPRQLQEVAP